VTAAVRRAEVRFYFDADVLGLAKIVAALRNDATYPGDPGATIHRRARPACLISDPATPDRLWIPDAAGQGWLIITRDSRIQDHRAEVSAVREHGAKMVALTGRDARSTWQQLEVFMRQWRGIEDLAESSGPFIWRATRSSMSRVMLD
jgi:PIN like domain